MRGPRELRPMTSRGSIGRTAAPARASTCHHAAASTTRASGPPGGFMSRAAPPRAHVRAKL
ncbi:hypothetical protein JYU34_004757 [Plutella xylostella]|uniref:Uncharacterized protein n=1 Tax=Plutella xylostella TaxID=51655 RepID=A0ABQ7QYS3_PLUXY|nr:hypothetical protein JYU34_004757 [Plutella xylostella]